MIDKSKKLGKKIENLENKCKEIQSMADDFDKNYLKIKEEIDNKR